MIITKEICIQEFEPWMGAEDTYKKIEEAGKLDDLENYINTCYPNGINETKLNDMLWFDGDSILTMLGIETEEDE